MSDESRILTPIPPTDPHVVNASPTKEFFIYMLVKDIPLLRSILDLVDNSIDGARRLHGDGPYNDLVVRLEFDREHFKIADNCGGITIDQARNYAFRFGRPPGAEATLHSVGQFGVGMKRALFKLGTYFVVDSTTVNSHFAITVDVEEWKQPTTDWAFEFGPLEENLAAEETRDKVGTIITVTSLHENVAEALGLENFETRLRSEIQAAHQITIDNGLAVTVNGVPLTYQPALLLASAEIQPAYKIRTFEAVGRADVVVRMYAGIGDSDPSSAGWYVFCNGRLVLEADQTHVTGWGEGSGRTIPKYHNQFARFRGYVFFDSDDATRLPWNTTKTGVDSDSTVFRAVRDDMINMMRPVIDFLNKLDAERDAEEQPLGTAVSTAASVSLGAVTQADMFEVKMPAPERVVRREASISYKKPLERIERVKALLGVPSNREVGDQTFEYFYRMEVDG